MNIIGSKIDLIGKKTPKNGSQKGCKAPSKWKYFPTITKNGLGNGIFAQKTLANSNNFLLYNVRYK